MGPVLIIPSLGDATRVREKEREEKREKEMEGERDSSLNYSFSLSVFLSLTLTLSAAATTPFSLLHPHPFLHFRSARKTIARDAGAREMDQAGEAEKGEK